MSRQKFLSLTIGLASAILLAACAGQQATPAQVSATSPPEPAQAPTRSPSGAALSPAPAQPGTISPPLTLTSSAFGEGGTIPSRYTYSSPPQCRGDNYSPPLAWAGAPAGAKSFAVTMIDPDGKNWVHWVQFNIPATANALEEAVGGPAAGVKGVNDFGRAGYGGPCPPQGTHRYVITLYALDTLLSLPERATQASVQSAMTGHVLGQAQLIGLSSR